MQPLAYLCSAVLMLFACGAVQANCLQHNPQIKRPPCHAAPAQPNTDVTIHITTAQNQWPDLVNPAQQTQEAFGKSGKSLKWHFDAASQCFAQTANGKPRCAIYFFDDRLNQLVSQAESSGKKILHCGASTAAAAEMICEIKLPKLLQLLKTLDNNCDDANNSNKPNECNIPYWIEVGDKYRDPTIVLRPRT